VYNKRNRERERERERSTKTRTNIKKEDYTREIQSMKHYLKIKVTKKKTRLKNFNKREYTISSKDQTQHRIIIAITFIHKTYTCIQTSITK